MSGLARIMVYGNLTSDPETKKVNTGKNVTVFSVAVNHRFGFSESSEDVSYFDVEAWEKQGEYCESRLKKGNPVIVWGRMKQERWKSSDGTSRQKMKIVAEDVRLLEREKSESKNEEREQRKAA